MVLDIAARDDLMEKGLFEQRTDIGEKGRQLISREKHSRQRERQVRMPRGMRRLGSSRKSERPAQS